MIKRVIDTLRVVVIACIVVLLMILGIFWWVKNVAFPNAQISAQKTYNRIVSNEQQQLDTQEQSLSSHLYSEYQGDGFTINVPSAWQDNKQEELGYTSDFGQNKVWSTVNGTVKGYNEKYEELGVVWAPDVPGGALNKLESVAKTNLKFPDQYISENLTIQGASSAFITYSKSTQSFTALLFVHSKNTLYMVSAGANILTVQESDAFRKDIVLSFKLKS